MQTGVGAVLTQTDDKGIRPVAYALQKLSPTEQGYLTHERELLGIVLALEIWVSYCYGAKFVTLPDYHPFKYLESQKTLSRKQARWVEVMQEFNFATKYIKGKTNHVSHALSRKHNPVHKLSSDAIRKLFNVATVTIKEKTIQNLNQEYTKYDLFKEYVTSSKKPFLWRKRRLCLKGCL